MVICLKFLVFGWIINEAIWKYFFKRYLKSFYIGRWQIFRWCCWYTSLLLQPSLLDWRGGDSHNNWRKRSHDMCDPVSRGRVYTITSHSEHWKIPPRVWPLYYLWQLHCTQLSIEDWCWYLPSLCRYTSCLVGLAAPSWHPPRPWRGTGAVPGSMRPACPRQEAGSGVWDWTTAGSW